MKHCKIIFLIWSISAAPLIGQTPEKIDINDLISLLKPSEDTTYVINFWATWCSPCVKEIAYFEDLHRQHISDKVKVVLISLDFPDQITKRVVPFLEDKMITADVKIMMELDYNKWISLVDPSWSGAIPATLIFNRESRSFFEKELSESELFEIVELIHN